jgi:hypothetical protein
LQNEGRLPLHLIKRAIDVDPSIMDLNTNAMADWDLFAASSVDGSDLIPLSSVLHRSTLAEADAHMLARVGVLRLVNRSGEMLLTAIDARLVRMVGDMRAAGFTDDLAFPAEVWRVYVETAERLAEADVRILSSCPIDRKPGEPLERELSVAVSHLMCLFGVIRTKTLLAKLKAWTGTAKNPSNSRKTHRKFNT